MRIFVPAETTPGERRVAGVPDSIARLVKLGHQPVIESGAGQRAGFSDEAYRAAGAEIASDPVAEWSQADAVFKVRPTSDEEIARLSRGVILACYLQPATNGDLLQKLADAGVTALALDAVPRTSRAQSMDTLSAMANIAGYRAVIESANAFGRFFGGQMTAAGRLPPAKVLVIGAGVAGLAGGRRGEEPRAPSFARSTPAPRRRTRSRASAASSSRFTCRRVGRGRRRVRERNVAGVS